MKAKFIDKSIYNMSSQGFRIARVTYEKFDYGTLDETHYSRVYKFFLDADTEPMFLAYQYAKSGKMYLYQNLHQVRVRFSKKRQKIEGFDLK